MEVKDPDYPLKNFSKADVWSVGMLVVHLMNPYKGKLTNFVYSQLPSKSVYPLITEYLTDPEDEDFKKTLMKMVKIYPELQFLI